MARNEITYTVKTDDTENRDKGKVYLITEWDVYKCEAWSIKVLSASITAGVEVMGAALKFPTEAMSIIGAEQIIGIIARIPPAISIPLINELIEGVQLVPDISRPQLARKLLIDDIQEGSTLAAIKAEVIRANMAFFKGVIGLILKALAEKVQKDLPNTETSPT